MILVVGNKGCSKCKVTQDILSSKEIEFEYKLIDDMNPEDVAKYMTMARAAQQNTFPILIKDDLVVTLQEVLG